MQTDCETVSLGTKRLYKDALRRGRRKGNYEVMDAMFNNKVHAGGYHKTCCIAMSECVKMNTIKRMGAYSSS
jgi:hypothetical protein